MVIMTLMGNYACVKTYTVEGGGAWNNPSLIDSGLELTS